MENTNIVKQAVILAAGQNSRFAPFIRQRHKCTFPLLGEPIVAKTIKSLKLAGIEKIEVIKSPKDKEIVKIINDLSEEIKGVKIRLYDQKKPLGMGNALLESGIDFQDRFLLLNPQQINIDEHLSLLNMQDADVANSRNVVLFAQKTDQPQKYGILALDGNKVKGVIEKPIDMSGLSDMRILGIYLITSGFIEFLRSFPISEYQFEEALDKYSRENNVVAFEDSKPAVSLKYAWDLFSLTDYIFGQFPDKPRIHPNTQIHHTALLSGPVVVEEGAKIYEYAIIQGPCFIGKNALVGSYCKVRKGSVLEEGVEVENNAEIKHSIISKNTHVHSGFIGDSIIGEEVRIGANFITANRRLDRKSIRIKIKEKLVDTEMSFLGAMIGDGVKIGIHCGTNPGVIIEKDSIILPGMIIKG